MRLLGLAPEEIEAEIKAMEQDSKALRKMIMDIGWYMRGFLSHEEAWNLSPSSRDMVMKIINTNVDRVKKTGMPLL